MDDKIYFGWDIGGANTKLAICNSKCEVIEFYFEVIPIWESTKPLEDFFHFVLNKFPSANCLHLITFTAESCDNFSSRSEGINYLTNLCEKNLSGKIKYYSNSNSYIDFYQADKFPEQLYSTNWMLTLNYIKRLNNINLIIDIGSTTTDFIYKDMNLDKNIDDFSRLKNKTLLYQGVVRTPLAMLANKVTHNNQDLPIIKEVYATTGDVFCMLDDIDFSKLPYVGSDNLPFSKENSYRRILRSFGLDENYKDSSLVISISKQLKQIFLENILGYISHICKTIKSDLVISSIGEGRKLIQEVCYEKKIKHENLMKSNLIIDNEHFNNVDQFSHFTSFLVILNYFEKNNE